MVLILFGGIKIGYGMFTGVFLPGIPDQVIFFVLFFKFPAIALFLYGGPHLAEMESQGKSTKSSRQMCFPTDLFVNGQNAPYETSVKKNNVLRKGQ